MARAGQLWHIHQCRRSTCATLPSCPCRASPGRLLLPLTICMLQRGAVPLWLLQAHAEGRSARSSPPRASLSQVHGQRVAGVIELSSDESPDALPSLSGQWDIELVRTAAQGLPCYGEQLWGSKPRAARAHPGECNCDYARCAMLIHLLCTKLSPLEHAHHTHMPSPSERRFWIPASSAYGRQVAGAWVCMGRELNGPASSGAQS